VFACFRGPLPTSTDPGSDEPGKRRGPAPDHPVQTVRRGLRHIQYRSHLIDGCLAETGLTSKTT
jgi:hypothetical protein